MKSRIIQQGDQRELCYKMYHADQKFSHAFQLWRKSYFHIELFHRKLLSANRSLYDRRSQSVLPVRIKISVSLVKKRLEISIRMLAELCKPDFKIILQLFLRGMGYHLVFGRIGYLR